MTGRTYRYFKGQPLYPFGYGLSYTQFAYEAPQLSTATLKAGNTLTVTTHVRNTGTRAGDEVVQLYLEPPYSPQAPLRSLVGFKRVTLRPGESRLLTFTLDARQLSSVQQTGQRSVEAGHYHLFVGGGQPNTSAPGGTAAFSIIGRALLPK